MKIIRAPLFHFLLLGAAIFAIYGFAKRHSPDRPGEIVVTPGTLENLVTGFTRTWQRPPTEGELQGLVRDYIREEAAYREALALGLDRDDMIVRRRLRQKLEFLSDELATRTEPSDAELLSFRRTHVGLFQTESLYSFRQIYFNPQVHGGNLRRDTARALEDLEHAGSRANTAELGDPFLLQRDFERVSLSDIKKTFGDQFASALAALRLGVWQGPIDSGYGTHLVFVAQRSEGRLPRLDEVRDQVRREWLDAKRKEATDKFYQTILSRYRVRIEPEEKKVAQVH
jgi:hypothetical protein